MKLYNCSCVVVSLKVESDNNWYGLEAGVVQNRNHRITIFTFILFEAIYKHGLLVKSKYFVYLHVPYRNITLKIKFTCTTFVHILLISTCTDIKDKYFPRNYVSRDSEPFHILASFSSAYPIYFISLFICIWPRTEDEILWIFPGTALTIQLTARLSSWN